MLSTTTEKGNNNMSIQKLANPAPLGLLGFGLTTVLLNLHNAGLFSLDTMILSNGHSIRWLSTSNRRRNGVPQRQHLRNIAFTSYGFFWLSLVLLLIMPKMTIFTGLTAPSATSMAAFFLMWGLFSFAMFFGTLKSNKTLQFVFFSLVILFVMLAIRELTGNPVLFGNVTWNTITGIEGVICGSSAIYLGVADVINEVHGRTILPIFA